LAVFKQFERAKSAKAARSLGERQLSARAPSYAGYITRSHYKVHIPVIPVRGHIELLVDIPLNGVSFSPLARFCRPETELTEEKIVKINSPNRKPLPNGIKICETKKHKIKLTANI